MQNSTGVQGKRDSERPHVQCQYTGLITPSRIYFFFFRNHVSVAIQLHSAIWHKKMRTVVGNECQGEAKRNSLSPSPHSFPLSLAM